MQLRPILLALAVGLAPVIAAAPAAFAEPAIYVSKGSTIAVQGYDPVAYFKTGAPAKGSADFTATYMGATFQFASAANRDAFKADPAAFAPQYGGYCAWAVSEGYHAKGDARNWKIVDGKLYLNYNSSIQRKWEKDVPGFITKANAQWPVINE